MRAGLEVALNLEDALNVDLNSDREESHLFRNLRCSHQSHPLATGNTRPAWIAVVVPLCGGKIPAWQKQHSFNPS
jgi:hypothetical protein